MNILIVDDQTSVVNGLRQGIDWASLGIGEVYCAYNAYEARENFREHAVDIMLCDIEMPMESGLELLLWVRNNNLDTVCIFLTSHAEFEYAKEAISLKSFDYILQPAPYEEVAQVVKRAIDEIVKRKEQKRVCDYGKEMMSQSSLLRDQAIGDWVFGRISREEYGRLASLEELPRLDACGTLVLLQVLEQPKLAKRCEPALLKFIFHNVISEYFYHYEQSVAVCGIDPESFLVLIYGTRNYNLDHEGVLRQMGLVFSAFQECLKCEAVFYLAGTYTIDQMPEIYGCLEGARRRNVLLKPGVFEVSLQMSSLEEKEGIRILEKYFFSVHQNRWRMYLEQELTDAVCGDAWELLDQIAEDGQLSYWVLQCFLLHYNKLLNSVIESGEGRYPDIFSQEAVLLLHEKAADSLDNMKSYIRETLRMLDHGEPGGQSTQDQLKLIDAYIYDHMGEEIHRSDIADYLHLNVDYLGRLFKKQRGSSLKEYIIAEKMKVARELLRTTMLPIGFVAAKVGYSSFSHFSRIYKKVFGISPTEERKE